MFSSVLLPAVESELRNIDRGLCHELVLGVLRRQLPLDRQIDFFARGKKLDAEVRIALRLGIYQLRYLDRVPAYSAINDSVDLTGRAGKASAKGLVNAILRRAMRETPELEFSDEIDRISVETSHPRWLIEKWVKDFGPQDAGAIAETNNDVPDIAYRMLGQANEQVKKLIEASRKSAFAEGCFIASKGDANVVELSAAGKIYLQDEASQMVPSIVKMPSNGSFLDVCAAPGGKTGIIAAAISAVTLVAGDLIWQRVEFLRQNLAQQDIGDVNILQYDAVLSLPFAAETFDTILVDAPCSGTGTIRHNPEIRYFLQPEDFDLLSRKQLSILTNASKLLKKEGLLIYSTCSIEKEENEVVCESFLAEHHAFHTEQPNVPSRFLTADGYARTWPHRDGMDGFFIAAFRKK